MSPRNPVRLVVGLLGGLLVLLGLGLASLFEQVEEQERIPPGWRARQNPHLALERTLTQLGLPTTSTTELDLEAPEEPWNTRLLLLRDQPLAPAEVDVLLGWVAQGGNLVYAPPVGEGDAPPEDPLLDRLGLRLSGTPQVPLPLSLFGLVDVPLPRRMRTVSPPWAARPLALNPRSDVKLVADAPGWTVLDSPAEAEDLALIWLADSPQDPTLTERVVVLADRTVLDNEHLAEEDHAALAWALAHPGVTQAVVVYGARPGPDLSAWLWANARPAVISALVLALAWMGSAAQRFGPLLAPASLARRQLVEALRANGAWLWRTGNAATLLDALRAEVIWSRLGGRVPAGPEPGQRLAQRAGLDPEAVDAALRGPHPADRAGFVRAVVTLNILRRSV